MARKLALIALVLVLGLALWFLRGTHARAPLEAPPAGEQQQTCDLPLVESRSLPTEPRVAVQAPEPPKDALLVVLCRAKETGAPLAEQWVHVYAELHPCALPQGTPANGKPGEILVTAADGRVEYEIAPGTPAHLTANPKKFGANASGSR